MPAYSITIANILNNVSMTERSEMLAINFTAPDAHILVVDDNKLNLAVAKGLLAPYKAAVDTCERGEDSIVLARTKKYDVIFMDHAMPGMDGIETTECLRGMPETADVPIIALTANAVSGMREIFLTKGMNDFISKPIEPAKLDDILRKWLPPEKIVQQEEPSQATETRLNDQAVFSRIISRIHGLEVQKALARFSTMELYADMLSVYAAYTGDVLDKLREPSENNLKMYAVSVHGLKGSSYGICANIVGKMAEELETSSKAGDLKAVLAHNNDLLVTAQKLIADIKTALAIIAPSAKSKEKRQAPDRELLRELLSACESYDFTRMERIIEELLSFEYEEDSELIAWLSEQAENLEYAAITDKLREEMG
jgi:CheY-like chemotaxis protein